MLLVDKEFRSVVLKGRVIEGLCEGFSGLLLEYGGEFFVFVGREEVRWLVRGSTRR